jgi:exopolysaccharide biosynthesis operon protein EpsL
VAALGLIYAKASHADDWLVLKVSTALVHDDNIFRLPAGNTSALIGRPNAREQVFVVTTDAELKFSHSLQALDIELQQSSARHANFGYLDNTTHSYSATWRWAYSPRIHGTLSSNRKETTDAFTGEQDFTELNQQTTSTTRLTGIYEVDGNWRVTGGAARVSERSLQEKPGQVDSTATLGQVGLGYVFASGNTASYLIREASGKYQGKVLPSPELLDDRFKQQDHELRVSWSIDGKTTAQLMAMYVQRRHPNYPQRDYRGMNGAANLNIQLSGKTAMNLGVSRELSSYQTANSNFSQVDRLALGGVWSISPKMQARARYELGHWNYKGTPTASTTPSVARKDITHETAVSLEWQPYTFVAFTLALQKSMRKTNLPDLDYDSEMVNLSAQFIY